MASSNSQPKHAHDYGRFHLSKWSGFFKKPITERQSMVNNESNSNGQLPLNIADIMIENCIGTLSLPLGISPNFIIDHKHFIVPYCVEESSVIAAASSTSKLIAKNGGFTTEHSARNIMIGQVQILTIPKHSIQNAINILIQNESKYIKNGNDHFCASMVKRGGGIIQIKPRIITPRKYKHNQSQRDQYLVVHIHVDVCDAMGANKVNTVCEGLSTLFLNDLISNNIPTATLGLKILSNLCTERMTTSSFRIPIANLSWKGVDGMDVAKQIVAAYEFAVDDIYRATTNNKGIMNGMDAVAIALGQDWRAIESAAHCYATISNDGQYGPLGHYYIEYCPQRQCDCLCAYLTIPISVGTKGGSITTHPGYRYTVNHVLNLEMGSKLNSNNPNTKIDDSWNASKSGNDLKAKDIAGIIVSAGLASNFAAIRALAIEGIQKGHMTLHSKNIAHSVLNEEDSDLVEEVSQFMVKKNDITTAMARRYVMARNIEFKHRYLEGMNAVNGVIGVNKGNELKLNSKSMNQYPSSLMVQIPSTNGTVKVDVVIECLPGINGEAVHLEMLMDESHIVVNVGNEEKVDPAQIESIIKSMTRKKKINPNDEQRVFQEQMIWKLFGSNVDGICSGYHRMKELQNEEILTDIKGSSAMNEIRLLSLLIDKAVDQYRKEQEEVTIFMVSLFDAMKRYLIKTYHDGDESEFEKRNEFRNIKVTESVRANKDEIVDSLTEFRECLIRSLLRALIYRLKQNEGDISKENGYRILLLRLMSIGNVSASQKTDGFDANQEQKH